MVIRERKVHHGANRDRIGAVDLDRYRTLLHFAHPENSYLRLIDYRKAEKISLATRIRQRETPAAEVIRRDLFLLHLSPQPLDFAREAHDRHPFGGLDDRDEQALIAIHRYAEVDLLANYQRI